LTRIDWRCTIPPIYFIKDKNMPKLFEYQYEQIVSDYLSGMKQTDVAKKNGVGRGAVSEIVRARGYKTRSYTGERTLVSNRQWDWDYSFFEKRIPIVAYWAGFMMADGSLAVHRGSTLALTIQIKDWEHVLSLCRDVGISTDATYLDKYKEQIGIHLNYSHLPQQMLPWGIVPRKTYNYVEPQIDRELLPHYLRGWCDGDGSVYSYGRGARFTISGNLDALNWYAEKLKELGYSGNVNVTLRHAAHDYGFLYIGGANQVEKVRNLLLVDESFKLERRWNVSYESKRTTFTHICKNCGKEFQVPKFRHEKEPNHGLFCSRECRNIDQHKQHLVSIERGE
jgi:hypothetical protein